MAEQRLVLYPIASASNLGESIRIQMLLDRARLPYCMRGDNLYGIYGDAAMGLSGPMQFFIPSELKEQAEESLLEIFDVHLANMPAQCPACDAKVSRGEVDCPNCGLFLG
jgi:hypothetical protein